MESDYQKICSIVLPPFISFLQKESLLPESFDQTHYLALYQEHYRGGASLPHQPDGDLLPSNIDQNEPPKLIKCKNEECTVEIDKGEYCVKCKKLQGTKEVTPTKPPKVPRKKKVVEEEVIDEAQGIYKSVDGIKYLKRGDLKIALGKYNKEGTLGTINGRNRAGILKAGYIERIREENGKFYDLVHNLELIKKGEKYTIDDSKLTQHSTAIEVIRNYCETEGYVIEKSIKNVALDEGRGIYLNVDTQIVIQQIDDKIYAAGMYSGNEGLVLDFEPHDREKCDQFGYIIRYDKHILVNHREKAEVEPPAPVPEI